MRHGLNTNCWLFWKPKMSICSKFGTWLEPLLSWTAGLWNKTKVVSLPSIRKHWCMIPLHHSFLLDRLTHIISHRWKYVCRIKSKNLNCWAKKSFEFINLRNLSNFLFGGYYKFIFPMVVFSHSLSNSVLSDLSVLFMWIKEKEHFLSLLLFSY